MTNRIRTAILGGALAAASATAVAVVSTASPATAVVIPDRHSVTCETASFYPNYDSATGPSGTPRTLHLGDGIGRTDGKHPVYNGWAAAQDFGPNDWGFIRIECVS